MICPKCQKEVLPGVKFCGECGTPMPVEEVKPVEVVEEPTVVVAAPEITTVYCPKCAQVNGLNDRFCMKCGNNLEGVAPSNVPPVIEEKPSAFDQVAELAKKGAKEAKKAAEKAAKEAKKAADKAAEKAKELSEDMPEKTKGIPKPVLFAGLGVAAVALIVIAILVLGAIFGGGNDSYAMYVKDMEILYTDFSKDGPKEVTTRLVDDGDVDEYDMANRGYEYILSMFVAIRNDGNRVFYPDKIGDSMDLYYRDLDKPKKEPVKIDSDISYYAVDDAGKQMVYLKGEDGNLYVSDLEEKEKLASNVEYFYITDDMKTVLYRDDEFNIYKVDVKSGEKEKVVGDIDSLKYVSEDLDLIYYIKDDNLYKQPVGGDREKIASDVNYVVRITEDGEVYYVTAETYEVNMMDYVNDDMAATDAGIFEPEYPDYPSYPSKPYSWRYDSTEEYEAAYAQYELDCAAYEEECARLEAEYDEAYDRYWEKEDREWLRGQLSEYVQEMTDYTLHYYNGSDSVELLPNLSSKYAYTSAAEADVFIMSAYSPEEIAKVKLSDLESAYDVVMMVQEARAAGQSYYIVEGESLVKVELEDISNPVLSDDGKTLYYMVRYTETEKGSNSYDSDAPAAEYEEDYEPEEVIVMKDEADLFEVSIKKGALGESKQVDDDVYYAYLQILSDGKLMYYKNVDDGEEKGDLFVDGKEVDYDVAMYDVYESEEMGGLVFFTDWNEEKEYGTMKFYDGKESKKLEDDVHRFAITPAGDLYYLYDYSLNHYTGELYLYKKNGSVKIDEDVIVLMNVNGATNRVRGYDMY